MKREYQAPKAKMVDYCYDEQVTAASSNVSGYGDPQNINKCQQSSEFTCMVFWSGSLPCQQQPYSLRR